MPAIAFAAGGEYHVTDGVEFQTCWDKAVKDGGTVVLDRNVNISWNGYVLEDASITIDLNGHSITGVGSNAEYIFCIDDDGTLNVKDSKGDGYIQVGNDSGKYKEAILINDDDGTFVLKSGEIRGNQDPKCRLISNEGGTVNVQGGKITGNKFDGPGAGVYINEGGFYMSGGEISNNISTTLGGGVYFDGGMTTEFMMTGGEICYNEAAYGGGIYFEDGGGTWLGDDLAVLSGGKVDNNSAKGGGGIFLESSFDGVTICGNFVVTENEATKDETFSGNADTSGSGSPRPITEDDYYGGGGIHIAKDNGFSDAVVTLGGHVQVFDNYPTDCFCGMYGDCIEINDDLATGVKDHAWVGIAALPAYEPWARPEYVDTTFESGKLDALKKYNVCFFNFDPRKKGQEIVVMDEYSSEFCVTHNIGNMSNMKLVPSALKGVDGKSLSSDDYYVLYDDIYDLNRDAYYKVIRSQKSVDVDNQLLTSNVKEKVTLLSDYNEKKYDEDLGVTVYTYYYLCENYKLSEEFSAWPAREYFRNLYYKVDIQVENHRVDFEMNGHGDQVEKQIVKDREKATAPADPKEKGWIFEGWYADPDFENEFDFDKPITEKTTVYAKWTKVETVTLSFDMNGHGEQVEYQTIPKGECGTLPDPEPTEQYCSFEGWYTDNNFKTEFDFDTPITADTTVYAYWTMTGPPPLPDLCIVNFEMNGHGNPVGYQKVYKGNRVTEPSPEPEDDEWTFEGWYNNSSFSGNVWNFEVDPVLDDMTLYAKWTNSGGYTSDVTFSFNMNGHGLQEPYQTLNSGDKATRPTTDPSELGWKFEGWFTEETLKTEFDFDTSITKNTIVYAKWTAATTHTLNFDMNGHGDQVPYQIINTGEKATKPKTNPAEAGWTFGGWYQEAACTNEFDFNAAVTADLTAYAKWTKSPAASVTDPEATNSVYNGTEQELVTAGSASGGTMMYAVSTSPKTPADGWSEDIPKATDAGKYYVHYYAKGDSDHSDSEYKYVVATISKADIIYKAPEAVDGLVYDGEQKTLVTPGECNAEKGKFLYVVSDSADTPTWGWSEGIPTAVNAGKYYVHYYIQGTDNYKDTTPAKLEVEIKPLIHTVTFDSKGGTAIEPQKVEHGKPIAKPKHDPEKEGFIFGGWCKDAELTQAYYFGSAVNSDTTLYAKWVQDTAEVVTPPTAISGLVYTGEPLDLITAGTATGGTMMYAVSDSSEAPLLGWSAEIPQKTDAGDYYVHYFVEGDTTHADSKSAYVKVTVDKAEPKYTAPEPIEDLVYNGEAQKLAEEGTSENGTIFYVVSDSDKAPVSGWKRSIDKKSDIGIYYIHYFVKAEDNYKDTEPKCVKIEINSTTKTVMFESNGGSYVQPQTVSYGKPAVKPADPVKDGLVFAGWFKEAECLNQWDFSKDVVEADITLYALWKVPGGDPDDNNKSDRDGNSSGTGDDNNIISCVIAMMLSLAVAAAVLTRRRTQRR